MTTANDVLLFVPNLVGYGRVLCTLASLILIAFDSSRFWVLALFLYTMSFVGDLFDGMLARKLNQTSTFGGVLDMITDRCSTLGFLFILSGEYADVDSEFGFPFFRLVFLLLVLLDISSHWCQMYSTAVLGLHHKSGEGNADRNFLVRWFYQYYYFFGYLCVGAEFTYIAAFAVKHSEGLWVHPYIVYSLWICIPGCALKQAVNVMQLCSACYAVAKHDAEAKDK